MDKLIIKNILIYGENKSVKLTGVIVNRFLGFYENKPRNNKIKSIMIIRGENMKQITIKKFIDILIDFISDGEYITAHPETMYNINDYIIILRAYDTINELHYGNNIYQIYYDTCDIIQFDIVSMLTGECFKIQNNI